MAKAQGAYRLARGRGYFDMMTRRQGGVLAHRLFEVPDVGHDGTKMFGSACGLRALFDKAGCAGDM